MSTKRIDLSLSESLHPELATLLAALDNATATWRKELGEVSEDAIARSPFPSGHNIGALLLHMADTELFWIGEVGGGVPMTEEEIATLLSEETHQYDARWPVPPAQPLSWFYEQQDRIRESTRRVVTTINDPDHVGQRADNPGHEYTLRWLLGHITQHDAYHGGQIALLSSIYAHRETIKR